MSEAKLGVDKVEAIVKAIKELVIVGKLVKADGKVDLADIGHVVALLPKLSSYVEAFKDVGLAFSEIKDVDVSEVIVLIQAVNNAIKEIEKA